VPLEINRSNAEEIHVHSK